MAKSKQGGYFDGFSIRYLLLHPAVWFVAATSLLVIGAIQLWERYSYRIIEPERYSISNVKLDLDPAPPPMFGANLENELRNGLQSVGSLLSPELVPQTAALAQSIPWVRKIKYINKHSSGLTIQLEYRTPVALIDLPNREPIAVDGDGVFFDQASPDHTDMAQSSQELMRISMFRVNLPDNSGWQTSSDGRLRHAASLCEFLQPCFRELLLYRVVSLDLPQTFGDSHPQFEIWTRNGTRIGWGSSPGNEAAGEAQASLKIELVKQLARQYDGLESFPHRDQQTINVSSGQVKYVNKIRNAELDRLDSLHRLSR